LYSFKEKYSDEVINSQNESLNDNFLKSWDDIGTDIAKIGHNDLIHQSHIHPHFPQLFFFLLR
jgi:hypothetical protein